MGRFEGWEKIIPVFKYEKDDRFFDILVPTVDTVRFGFIMEKLISGFVENHCKNFYKNCIFQQSPKNAETFLILCIHVLKLKFLLGENLQATQPHFYRTPSCKKDFLKSLIPSFIHLQTKYFLRPILFCWCRNISK